MRKKNTENRCQVCGFRRPLCICGELKKSAVKTELMLIQHYMDAVKPSNTGKIIAAITGCRVMSYGKNIDDVLNYDEIAEACPLILYPGRNSVLLSEKLFTEKKRTLVVLDGTWSQAARLASKLSRRFCDFVHLPDSLETHYTLRDSGDSCRLCTGEAVIAALRILGEDVSAIEQGLSLFIRKNLLLRPHKREADISPIIGG